MSYATTPTLSVDAPQCSVRPDSPMSEQDGWPGIDGGWVSPATPALSRSRFGPPLAVVAVARILLAPAARLALMVTVCQVVQAPVPGKARPGLTRLPSIAMSSGRFT